MNIVSSGLCAALCAAFCVPACHADHFCLPEAEVSYDGSVGLDGLEVRIGQVRFRPLVGAGIVGPEGSVDRSLPVRVHIEAKGDALRLHLSSPAACVHGFDPGRVEGLRAWRRLDLSRLAEMYGQLWWPKTTYSVRGRFWFTAHWVMEDSNGTSWEAPNQKNSGEGPFPAAQVVTYAPDTEGRRLPLREVLEISVSRDLWRVVPQLRQRPSEYRRFLAAAVQLDLWGGRAAPELEHLLTVMGRITRGRQQFITILQNWEVGGWDALLPDSIWLPDYAPNSAVGTVEHLANLCELGKSLGRFGFRTNYRILRENSPSFLRGVAHFAVDADGKPLDYLRTADWPIVAGRQEQEIRELWRPNASFTDQLTSGAAPWLWHDYAAEGGSRSMRETLERQKNLARLIRRTHQGPLGSETLFDQQLLGEFVDTGDYGIADAHHRLLSPEYKLRRLHHLTGFHGMGLMYRFYEMPPFDRFHNGTTTFGSDPEQLDDYRACEVLYGNGAYVCYPFANWSYWLTEVLLVGNLQQHYTLQPVRAVRYWKDGSWRTLEELVKRGVVPNVCPWEGEPTEEFGRVRVEYENGLNVVVNRLPGLFPVPDAHPEGMCLPRYGWVAWKADGSLVAFSAGWPGTEHRVDYLRDDAAQLEYIDPRGESIRGVSSPTLWHRGSRVLSADLEAMTVTVDGETLPLVLPPPEPLTELAFEFSDSMEGWATGPGILTTQVGDGALHLRTVTEDPQLYGPAFALDAAAVAAIEIRMRTDAGELGQLYFTTEQSPGVGQDKVVHFTPVPDGQWHTYRLDVAGHPQWSGKIVGLRLDPVHGPAKAEVAIDYIKAQ